MAQTSNKTSPEQKTSPVTPVQETKAVPPQEPPRVGWFGKAPPGFYDQKGRKGLDIGIGVVMFISYLIIVGLLQMLLYLLVGTLAYDSYTIIATIMMIYSALAFALLVGMIVFFAMKNRYYILWGMSLVVAIALLIFIGCFVVVVTMLGAW